MPRAALLLGATAVCLTFVVGATPYEEDPQRPHPLRHRRLSPSTSPSPTGTLTPMQTSSFVSLAVRLPKTKLLIELLSQCHSPHARTAV
jgi:hypothetical protein